MGIFDKVQIFEKENKLNGLSMMELILCYIEENNLELEDVADELKRDKTFVKLFQGDLIQRHEARFSNNKKVKGLEEWL